MKIYKLINLLALMSVTTFWANHISAELGAAPTTTEINSAIDTCNRNMDNAIIRRKEIENMTRPSHLDVTGDGMRKKARFDNKAIHLKAFDEAANQASQYNNDNRKSIFNQTQAIDIARMLSRYTSECQTQVDSLNGFVDWTVKGLKEHNFLSIYETWIKKAK